MTSADEMLTAIFATLDADATLQGASYLNGTDKVEKGPRRKEGVVNPSVTIKLGGTDIATEGKIQDAIVYVSSFCNNYGNGAANVKTLSLISNKVDDLLDDKSLTISGSRAFNCYLTAPHNGPYWDSQHPDEHYMTSTFRIQVIDLS